MPTTTIRSKAAWEQYRIRRAARPHHCAICNRPIRVGQDYHEGGDARTAHTMCVTLLDEAATPDEHLDTSV